ncbi:MAG: hypothetical protein QF363_15180, partial [Planctomycetaceae bacterium]|nr:hypothetical protein [Planctomycetaceae bacterium]
MTHFFAKRDRFGHGNALWVILLLVFLAAPAIWSLTRIDLENDIANWLPEDNPQARTLRWYKDHFKHEDRVLVSWTTSTLADPRVDWFRDRLEGHSDKEGTRRSGSKLIKSVTTPQDLIAKMIKFDVVPREAVRRLEGVLVGTGPLKVRLSDLGRRDVKQVKRLIRERAAEKLRIQVEFLPTVVEWEPGEEQAHLVDENESEQEADGEDDAVFDAVQFALPDHDFQVHYA